MKRLVGYFFQGVLYVAPLGVTAYILYQAFVLLDEPVRELEVSLFGRQIPGLGLLSVLALLTLFGWLGSTIIAAPLKAFTRRVIERTPLIGAIEGTVRDLLSAFFAKERKFSHPVLVQMSGASDLEKLGFITQEDLAELGLREKVAVYFPHSYNFSGELFIVPRERVRVVDIPAQEAMKFIVSGGLIHLREHRERDASPTRKLDVASGGHERRDGIPPP